MYTNTNLRKNKILHFTTKAPFDFDDQKFLTTHSVALTVSSVRVKAEIFKYFKPVHYKPRTIVDKFLLGSWAGPTLKQHFPDPNE